MANKIPISAVEPSNETDDRPMVTQYTDFIDEKRRLIRQGYSVSDVLGPPYVNASELLNRRVPHHSKSPFRTVCQWAADVIRVIEDTGMPDKVALMLMIVRFMRVSTVCLLMT